MIKDFFKIFRRKIEAPEKMEELISINEVENKINELISENRKQEILILEKAREKIILLKQELNLKIEILEQVNLKNRRETAFLKERVLNAKNDYINYCLKFLTDILNINEMGDEFFNKVDIITSRFKKESFRIYETATILIGEEMCNTKESITKFYRNQNEIYNENKNIFLKKNLLSGIIEKYNILKEIEKNKLNIKAEIKNTENELDYKLVTLQNKKDKLSEFKETDEFKETLENKKLEEERKKKLIERVSMLKKELDFKNLMGIYHKNKKYMELINKYRDNFLDAIIEDNEMRVAEIIPDKSDDFITIREELLFENTKFSEIKQKEIELERDISDIKSEVFRLKEKVQETEKRFVKIEARQEEETEKLKKELVLAGIKVR
ncbi:MAG: hypothetical protein Q8N88_03615 [Nanoarchaeota archaeon]|nr:hypothetical protein [Nanoarchaeota archaeon]